MRRPTRLLATAVAALAPLMGLLAPQALHATAVAAETTTNGVRLNGYEAKLVAQINAARRQHGVRTLVVVAGASDVARRWSWHLARAQALSHNPSLASAMEQHGS